MTWPSLPAHHGEPADPTLLEWIGHRIDELVPAGPLAIVIVLGIVIVGLPAALMVWYGIVRRRGANRSE